ncbi:phenylalanine--tRNA ligase subunit beta [Candidatus Woesearchaeota archaeon]|nr:phenylalanine--tRNA ligase subunit beta [Candidatus Woesearchaeota archaeon]
MPTVTLNRKTVEKLVGKKLPEDKLKDRISMLGTDLEEVTDEEIIVEIFPNRPDLLSEQGFGRALSSFIGLNTGLRNYHVKKTGAKVFVDKGMENVRPYTVCAIIKNLKLDDEKIREIIQIQEKLHVTFCRKRKKAAIGIYPLEKIKLPIYFTSKKPEEIIFRPLEWKKEINAKEILEQHPTGIKYKDLVKGLKRYAIFHDADENILSFTPIINSHMTGKINDKTKEAFLEVSGFDLHTANYVLNIMVTALADMGADIYSMEVVYPDRTLTTPDLSPRKMKVDYKYINKWLGLDLSEKEFKKYLEMMGFGYEDKHALIPAYRPDVIHPVDLGEDVAIAYGYENFEPVLPEKATTGKENDFEKFRKQVSKILAGLNMLELSSYHLANKDTQFKRMSFEEGSHVEIANSVSEEYNIMRWWMLPQLMQVLQENTHNEYPQNIFESGVVFKLDDKEETGVKEFTRLAAALCGNDADYTKIRQILDYLLRSIGLEYEIKETEHPSFIGGRVGRVYVKGKAVAYIGEIHPFVLENFAVEMPVAAFELNLSEVFSLLSE